MNTFLMVQWGLGEPYRNCTERAAHQHMYGKNCRVIGYETDEIG